MGFFCRDDLSVVIDEEFFFSLTVLSALFLFYSVFLGLSLGFLLQWQGTSYLNEAVPVSLGAKIGGSVL